ncbi:hypothetical protein EV421DRAFT_1742119 [Armillaria borealis]|uniref:Uncharacterized protein n=1 Tax=Armillaria borealis TaxID=47425 RepID=A0AA39MFV0_9AGAR|nr:hypothetical protein EV421DRAFT_1742119 [Armillaria borealis]
MTHSKSKKAATQERKPIGEHTAREKERDDDALSSLVEDEGPAPTSSATSNGKQKDKDNMTKGKGKLVFEVKQSEDHERLWDGNIVTKDDEHEPDAMGLATPQATPPVEVPVVSPEDAPAPPRPTSQASMASSDSMASRMSATLQMAHVEPIIAAGTDEHANYDAQTAFEELLKDEKALMEATRIELSKLSDYHLTLIWGAAHAQTKHIFAQLEFILGRDMCQSEEPVQVKRETPVPGPSFEEQCAALHEWMRKLKKPKVDAPAEPTGNSQSGNEGTPPVDQHDRDQADHGRSKSCGDDARGHDHHGHDGDPGDDGGSNSSDNEGSKKDARDPFTPRFQSKGPFMAPSARSLEVKLYIPDGTKGTRLEVKSMKKYDGEASQEVLWEWLHSVVFAYHTSQLGGPDRDEERVLTLDLLLVGKAKTWFQQWDEADNTIQGWQDTLQQLIDDMDAPPDDYSIKDKFMLGLLSSIRNGVFADKLSVEYNDWEELYQSVLDVEYALKAERWFSKPSWAHRPLGDERKADERHEPYNSQEVQQTRGKRMLFFKAYMPQQQNESPKPIAP